MQSVSRSDDKDIGNEIKSIVISLIIGSGFPIGLKTNQYFYSTARGI